MGRPVSLEAIESPGRSSESGSAAPLRMPRIAFLGVGWIGRNRLEAVVQEGVAEVVGIADPAPDALEAALALAPGAGPASGLDALLSLQPDGVVIATPSAKHAGQAIRALNGGAAVFCQKPLGRTAAEVDAVLAAARAADRFLAVDLSYRATAAMRHVRDAVRAGQLGRVFAADLTFHNAYGPDKPWFYDPALSGGGCVMDLGVHLVDLALWVLGFPPVLDVHARLHAGGHPVQDGAVEDHATVHLDLEGGVAVRIACSWNLHAGRDAVIEARFQGTAGGVAMSNVDGSFYDFVAERFDGTGSRRLVEPPDAWGGRALIDWTRRIATDTSFDTEADRYLEVARVVDRIYDAGR
jgi:predicted dehydrogenase